MSKRILITGASGLLGRPLYNLFQQDGAWEVLGLAYTRATGQLRKVDITNSNQLQNVLMEFKPTVIIHAAAERRPDVVETNEKATHLLNVETTGNLCALAKNIGAFVLYISTDYVFDGKAPPFETDSTPNPLNKYGSSKLAGETATLNASETNMVVRVPILFGQVESLAESAVCILFEKVMMVDKDCVMSDYERRFPTSVEDLSIVLKQLIEKRLDDPLLTGIFHWSGADNMTKYDMAVAMAEVCGLPTSHIKPDRNPSEGAPRPYNAYLSSKRIESLNIHQRTAFRKAILPCIIPFLKSN